MLSVTFYRNLRRNLFYGIYSNKFHTICREKFQKCDHRIGNTFTFCTDIPFAAHFNCAEKKSYIYVKNLNTWQLCGFFLLPFCLKYISYFHNILWLGTDAATSFLPFYLLLSPSRNYLFCHHRPLYIQSECLTLYIINKNYQWILTFGLLKYMLSSKLLGLFSYTCMLQIFCFNLYFIYLYLCYSYIFCFHFKDWRKRWIIHYCIVSHAAKCRKCCE
jgi:hypothetical protein